MKYIGFNVFQVSEGHFSYHGPDEQGFVYVIPVVEGDDVDGDPSIHVPPDENGNYRFSVDTGFYGIQEFHVSPQGENILSHEEKIETFFLGFQSQEIDENGIAYHPNGMQYFPAAK